MAKEYYHSHRYHSYFEGYTEKTVIENGKEKILRIYTGDYYLPQLSKHQRIKRKLLYWGLFLITTLLYGYLATRETAINLFRWVGICQGFTLLALLWLFLCLTEYTLRGEKLTAGEYRTTAQRLNLLSPASAILFGAMAVAYGASAFCLKAALPELLSMLVPALACTACMVILWQMEKKVSYIVEDNGTPSVKDGKKIEY